MARLRRLSHWILYRKGALIAVCILLVAVVGYIDYVTGYERPLLLFYLLPISLAVWFGSLLFGLSVAVIAIVAWMWSDLAAGIPALGFWNVGMAFAAFALFAGMLSRLRTLVRELDADGLTVALQGLAENITERFGIDCVFEGEESLPIRDSAIATQLYRIAQEAVANSIKHAAAQRITIQLAMNPSALSLAISDDGIGFPDRLPRSEGLGLQLMRHGASLAGASLDVRRNGQRGTIVTCKLNLQDGTDRV